MNFPTPNRLVYFALLSEAEKRAAILRLARSGFGVASIATATELAPEAIRALLGAQRDGCEECP